MTRLQREFWGWTLYQFHPKNIYRSVFEDEHHFLSPIIEGLMGVVGILYVVFLMVVIGIPLAFYRAVFHARRRWLAIIKEDIKRNRGEQ